MTIIIFNHDVVTVTDRVSPALQNETVATFQLFFGKRYFIDRHLYSSAV
jgi:hypothetical protein